MTKWKKRYKMLMFGRRRTELGFRFLSQSIQDNRKLISELRKHNTDLQLRVWALEDHSTEDTMAMVSNKMSEWTKAVEAMKESEASDG